MKTIFPTLPDGEVKPELGRDVRWKPRNGSWTNPGIQPARCIKHCREQNEAFCLSVEIRRLEINLPDTVKQTVF